MEPERSTLTSDLAGLSLDVRIFRGNRNLESFDPIFGGHARGTIMQHVVNEIDNLGEVGIGKARQEMVRKNMRTSARAQECGWSFIETADKDGAFRSHNFRPHVVS